MRYLTILLITLGSMNASNLHAGAGMATYLRNQAECGERCPNALERLFFKEDPEPEEEYAPDDGNDGGGYDGSYYDNRDEYYEYLNYLEDQSD